MDERTKGTIFRKETLERISSPEQLTDYLRVTTPGLWIIIGAVAVMLVGFFAWMSVGVIETTVQAGVSMRDHSAIVAIKGGGGKIGKDMTLRVGDKKTVILSTEEDDYGRTVGKAELDLPDGMYEGTLVTESMHPIQFLVSSK